MRAPVLSSLLAGIAGMAPAAAAAAAACLPPDWVRHDGPVLRDRLLLGLYEAASDAHVFDHAGTRAMIYSGDDGGASAIVLASRADGTWRRRGVLLGPSRQRGPRHKETAFHRATRDGHAIWFVGYEDEEAYAARLYRATAPALEGPWRIDPEPVVGLGDTDGRDVALVTSPSVVEAPDGLLMTWLGWDAFDGVTEVWTFAARSVDGGETWSAPRAVDLPIGMEGQVTRRPDGGYVAVATRDAGGGREGIFAACADAPLGPWVAMPDPLLVLARDRWEVDEITAPSIAYEGGLPRLYYTAAEHARGWRIMRADPR